MGKPLRQLWSILNASVDSIMSAAARVLGLMAADTSGLVHLKFGDEIVPMQLLIATQWSTVLATAIEADGKQSRSKVVIPMECSKGDWLTVMEFIYATSPHPAISWDNLEVLIRIADQYDMRPVLDMCAEFLLSKKEQLEGEGPTWNCIRSGWKWIADKAGLGEVARACFDAKYNDPAFTLEYSVGSKPVTGLSPATWQHISMAYAKGFRGRAQCNWCRLETIWQQDGRSWPCRIARCCNGNCTYTFFQM